MSGITSVIIESARKTCLFFRLDMFVTSVSSSVSRHASGTLKTHFFFVSWSDKKALLIKTNYSVALHKRSLVFVLPVDCWVVVYLHATIDSVISYNCHRWVSSFSFETISRSQISAFQSIFICRFCF